MISNFFSSNLIIIFCCIFEVIQHLFVCLLIKSPILC
jgi:hypothetical protein